MKERVYGFTEIKPDSGKYKKEYMAVCPRYEYIGGSVFLK
jgi:hypothetical protein